MSEVIPFRDKIDKIVYYFQKPAEHEIRSAHGEECSCKHVLPVVTPEVYALALGRLIRNGEEELRDVREKLREERRNPTDGYFRMYLEERLREMGEGEEEE